MNKSLLLTLLAAVWFSPARAAPPASSDRIAGTVASHYTLSKLDIDLLDETARRSFRYFMENTDLRTGLVLDRALVNGGEEPNHEPVASIAATAVPL